MIRWIIPPVVLFFSVSGYFSATAQILLADSGLSDYRIVIPSKPSAGESKAALQFQSVFREISSVTLPIVPDSRPDSEKEIVIGNSTRLEKIKSKSRFKDDEDDGFLIHTDQAKLFICGAGDNGLFYGVCSFFENYLGYRYYSPSVKHHPILNKVIINKIDDRQVPVFTFREMLFPARSDSAYRQWHKLDTHSDGSWGMWVHTFDDLVPAAKYFDEHPEYFSEINGNRVRDGQLCLSNPQVFDLVIENLRKKIIARPEALYWSVSQNDNFLACQCASCDSVAKKFGGQSGLMIWFVNRVAELFPDKIISTLAYQYTRHAPENIRPLPNVNIMLCSIECNRSKPLRNDPSSADFVKDVKDWTRLTENILVWDYVVQFRNYISPFPNLRVLQPNLEFFAGKGCKLMFQQGSGSSLSEFSDLRAYMIAKLLWDPYADADAIMKDFIWGYYGDAAPHILDYIGILHDELESSGGDLVIYGFPYTGVHSFLKPFLIPAYRKCFDEAENAVKDNPGLLARVHYARLPLDFAILDLSLHQVDHDLTWFTGDGMNLTVRQDMINLLDTFVNRCKRLDVNTLNEQSYSPEEYRLTVKKYLLKTSERHMGIGKAADILTEYSAKYEAGGENALTDGIRGINDYHFNWLGFEGNDLEAIIDLEEEKTLASISADFLQDIRSWIFLPNSFSAYYSLDGIIFHEIGTDPNITPDNKTGAFINTFTVPADGIRARYVKVVAESMKTCPEWHLGKGKNSWIFTDEIVIK